MISSRIIFISSIILSGIGFTNAISAGCENGFLTVASSSQGTCIDILGLVNLLEASGNNSALPVAQSWLSTACNAPLCTSTDLTFIATTIAGACAADLSSNTFQVNNATVMNLAQTVQEMYGLVHDIVCVTNTTVNQYVSIELLEQVQEFQNNNISALTWASLLAQLPLAATANLPTNLTCSEDVLALYDIALRQEPTIANSSEVVANFAMQCGANFLNNASPTLPSGYALASSASVYTMTPTTSASSSPSGSPNSATSFVPNNTLMSLAGTVLAIIASAFVFLA